MITGDQALIGRETAKQLGMGTNIFNTEVLLKVTPVTQFNVVSVHRCSTLWPCRLQVAIEHVYLLAVLEHTGSFLKDAMQLLCLTLHAVAHTGKGGQGCARRLQER